jgi:uncharacterized protein
LDLNTLVIGASTNSERYSFQAVTLLQHHGYPVWGLGPKAGTIGEMPIQSTWPLEIKFHTITLYLNPSNQEKYYPQILESAPTRVIFNPGTENEVLENLLAQNGIAFMHACTLVLLRTNQYETTEG